MSGWSKVGTMVSTDALLDWCKNHDFQQSFNNLILITGWNVLCDAYNASYHCSRLCNLSLVINHNVTHAKEEYVNSYHIIRSLYVLAVTC